MGLYIVSRISRHATSRSHIRNQWKCDHRARFYLLRCVPIETEKKPTHANQRRIKNYFVVILTVPLQQALHAALARIGYILSRPEQVMDVHRGATPERNSTMCLLERQSMSDPWPRRILEVNAIVVFAFTQTHQPGL